MGDYGNDKLASEADYVQQLHDNRTARAPWNAQERATPIVGVNSNFDAYEPFNPVTVAQAGSGYTASGGETLQAVALNLWGDGALCLGKGGHP